MTLARSALRGLLAAVDPQLADVDRKLMRASEQLILDQPEISDGKITVTNLCVEAGISRATYYRSAVCGAIKEILDIPRLQRPEIEQLRAEVAQLRQVGKRQRADNAAHIRQLSDTINTYANQIQILALRNAQLETENAGLRAQLASAPSNVTYLR